MHKYRAYSSPVEPEPRTLFYPVSTEESLTEINLIGPWLFVPFLLILALAAPVVALFFPVAWLACRLHNVPFTWNVPQLINKLDRIYEDNNPSQHFLK